MKEREMPLVESAGVPIYYEVVGDGFPVVLQTGGGGDGTMWKQGGYVAGLGGFTLILLDHRGHGRSGKPAELEAHRIERYVDDVLAVLDAEGIDRAAFWGYSGGATVGFALAASHPRRVAGLVAQGATGAEDLDMPEEREGGEELARSARAHGLGAFIKELETIEDTPSPDWFMGQMTATDDEMFALQVLGARSWHGPWSVLGDISCPVLLLVGEREDPEGEAARAVARLPNARCVMLPGLGHIGAYVRSDLALEQAVPFLRGIAERG
jgi:pimeloyl-ACP methyl ester carboxylesterase